MGEFFPAALLKCFAYEHIIVLGKGNFNGFFCKLGVLFFLITVDRNRDFIRNLLDAQKEPHQFPCDSSLPSYNPYRQHSFLANRP